MKRLTFILILITFFLIFSYSKPIVTGQAINEDYCDANNIFHLKQGGTNSCAEGCDDKKDCCGTLNDDCCTKENSDDAECGKNLICIDDFCKTSDDENLNEAEAKMQQKVYSPNRDICSVSDCEGLTKTDCTSDEHILCCDWDFKNTITESKNIPVVGCEQQKTESVSTIVPVCKPKPEPLR